MKLLDILNAPWMMGCDYHREISHIYKAHMHGEKIDFKAFEKAFFDDVDIRREKLNKLNVQNGVALIDVSGPLTPQASFFSFFFSGTSMPDIERQLKLADESNDVSEKLFVMNTPGGTVEMAFELADFVRESSKIKPIRTFTNGMIASAGYLIAAATDEIIISSETNQIGSIGVISRRSDWTEHDKSMGIEITEYVSGQYKNIYSPDKKRTEFDDKAIQETVDYLATIFVDKVSEYKGLDAEFISGLEAKLLIGQQAIEAGLVDGVSTLDNVINSVGSGVENVPSGKMKNKIEVKKMSETITIANLETDHKDVYVAVKEQGKIEGAAEGIANERKRIQGIHDAALPGQDAIAKECIDSGLSVGDSAQRMIMDQKNKLKVAADVLKAEAHEPVKMDEPVPVVKKAEPPKTRKEEFEASEALQDEYGDYETYDSYMTAKNSGHARVLGDK